MASVMALLFVILGLATLQAQASEPLSVPLKTVLSSKNTVANQLSLTLPAKPLCSGLDREKDFCPDAKGVVNYKYGSKTGRGGSLKVVDNADGTFTFTSEYSGAKTAGTDLKVGNCDCKEETSKIVKSSDCGFSQAVGKDGLVYREIVVQIRHRFPSGQSGVHFFGGKNILVRAYLRVSPPETVLKTPVYPVPVSIGTCSALNHTLTIEDAAKNNLWRFRVTANYNPVAVGVGFRLESCSVRPYVSRTGPVSYDPAHVYPLIANGQMKQLGIMEISQTGSPGVFHDISFSRIKPPPGRGPAFDSERTSVVECEVCLCSLSGSKGTLPACLKEVPFAPTGRTKSSFDNWIISEDSEETPSSLVAGEAVVVPNQWPMF